MILTITSLAEQPLIGSAAGLAAGTATPTVLSLALDDDEVLVAASLTLTRTAQVLPTPAITIDTNVGGGVVGVQWISAGWQDARVIEAATLSFAGSPSSLVVRASIARGDSSWFSPPGPHSFEPSASPLAATFPDAVAERLLFELFDDDGAPATANLAANPLTVALGVEPRDLSLAVGGRRPLLRFGGAIPQTEGIVVDDLLGRMEAELDGEVRGTAVELELRAEVAGGFDLAWSFSAVRVATRFAATQAAQTLSVPWASRAEVALLDADADPVDLDRLDLAVEARPVAEQLVRGSAGETLAGLRQLVRPLYDAAQSFALDEPWSLTGVDVRVRGLDDGTVLRVGLHMDDEGRPSPVATTESVLSIDATDEPQWIAVTLDEPVAASSGTWWIVVTVDQGELLWLVEPAESTEPAALLVRRDGAAWLPRADEIPASTRAMLRVRAAGVPPPMPLSLTLRGTVEVQGAATIWSVPLAIDEQGRVQWQAADLDAPPPTLRDPTVVIDAAVQATVVLSNLELRYRDASS